MANNKLIHLEYSKRGYLNHAFRLFHLCDNNAEKFDYHYHDFDKIVIFFSGEVTYVVEGKSYLLEPWDILLINRHEIHKPVIDACSDYERIVIWVSPEFIEQYRTRQYDLAECFHQIKQLKNNLIRVHADYQDKLKLILSDLESSLSSPDFASELLSSSYFIQFMIYLNRLIQTNSLVSSHNSISYDKQIQNILEYINSNLGKDLSLDQLANYFYVSKYHLMRKFKEDTGYTIHNYIQKKRLLLAADLIRQGMPITKACFECGFQEYSTFSRAFKTMFHVSPRDYDSVDKI
jgi:AraC-type DNA-binding domain-containing proteins